MFLGELDSNEKKAFYVLAKRLMSTDGRHVKGEAEMLEQMCKEMLFDPASIQASANHGNLTAPVLAGAALLGPLGVLAGVAASALGTAANQASTKTAPVTESSTDAELFAAFSSQKSRAIALMELIGLGHADSNYCAIEEEFINQMAGALGVTDAEVVAMENWVLRQLALVAEARNFMEEGA